MKTSKSYLGCLTPIVVFVLIVWGLIRSEEKRGREINWEISPQGISRDSLGTYLNKDVPYYIMGKMGLSNYLIRY